MKHPVDCILPSIRNVWANRTPFSAAFTATARHAPKKCAEECGALHCFPCLQVNPGCNYFSEITLEPFSLPTGGAQVISSDFATRRWSVATVVAAGPPHTRDGSESGAMLSRRQSKQIGNRSPLPACPTTCTASLLILHFSSAVFVVWLACAPPKSSNSTR